MAPSQSTLRGNKKPSWEVAQHCQHLRDQPAIRMEAPQKKPKDTPVPGAGVDPNHVSHDIHCEKGSTEKYTKAIFKLQSHCSPEDYCSWRCKIRDLLMAKESLGPVTFDLKKKLILSCMEAGEKAALFSTKCDEHMVEEMRQIGKQAAQEAAATAAEGIAPAADEAFLPDSNPQGTSAKKKKKKTEKEKDQETDGETDVEDPKEDPIPRKKPTIISPHLENAIWRAMNDLGLAIFPQGAQATRIQREYLTHSLQFNMGTTKPDKWANPFQLVNNYQAYFPLLPEAWSPTNRCPRLLDEEEKTSILLKAAPPKFYRDIKMQGTNSIHFKSMQSAVKFLTQLHEAAQFEKKMHEFNEHKRKHGSDGHHEHPKKRYKGGKPSYKKNNTHNSGFKKCSNCGKLGHLDSECYYKEEYKHQRPLVGCNPTTTTKTTSPTL